MSRTIDQAEKTYAVLTPSGERRQVARQARIQGLYQRLGGGWLQGCLRFSPWWRSNLKEGGNCSTNPIDLLQICSAFCVFKSCVCGVFCWTRCNCMPCNKRRHSYFGPKLAHLLLQAGETENARWCLHNHLQSTTNPFWHWDKMGNYPCLAGNGPVLQFVDSFLMDLKQWFGQNTSSQFLGFCPSFLSLSWETQMGTQIIPVCFEHKGDEALPDLPLVGSLARRRKETSVSPRKFPDQSHTQLDSQWLGRAA